MYLLGTTRYREHHDKKRGNRMNFLSLDVGTTCCKAQLFNEAGEILFYRAEEYALLERDGEIYVDAEGIRARALTLIRDAAATAHVSSIAVSSLGEAFVLLDGEDNILFPPMLYTDPRGREEAEKLEADFGADGYYAITGVTAHPMYSLPKLMYIKNRYPELYAAADKVLLICDYIGYLLTGERVIDYALASRTGALDIRRRAFSETILSAVDIPVTLFSRPAEPGCVVGPVLPQMAESLGLPADCVLVLGAHDQICAAIGAGVFRAGEAADGMGTVECVTPVFRDAPTDPGFGRCGYPTVPFPGGLYCTYITNYSSGSLVNWYRRDIMHGYSGREESFFAYMSSRLPESTELLCLPYFVGNVNPYQDLEAKGALVGLTLRTTDAEIYRAILEGTSMEMRLNLATAATFGIEVGEAVATGGGANSADWLRIKADVTGLSLSTLRSSEGGLCGCAMLQAVALGVCRDLDEAKKIFVRIRDRYTPAGGDPYAEKYARYARLYPAIKQWSATEQ